MNLSFNFIKSDNSGEILDSSGPVSYMLLKENLPLFQKFVNIPFGAKTPFISEIYFINKASKLDADMADHRSVLRYFKEFMSMKIKDMLINATLTNKLSNSEPTVSIDSISKACRSKINDEFPKFGIEIANLPIESINVPNDDTLRLRGIPKRKTEFTQIGDVR